MTPAAAPVRTGLLAILTGLLFSVGPAMVDLSLPAIPLIQQAIGTAALRAELNLTVVFFGMAIAQLVFGAVADRYGRRRPLLIGLTVYCLAALGAAFAPDMVTFLGARLLQSLAYGVAIVMARSAVVDVCDERSTARVFSTAIMMMSLTSVIAPSVGGALLEIWNWRAIFLAMCAFGAVGLSAAALWLPETLPAERRSEAPFARVFSTYGSLLGQRRFLACALVGACAVTYQFSYNTGAPAVVIEHYGLQPSTAGLVFSIIAISMAISSQVNAFALKWHSPERLMTLGVLASVLGSAVLFINVFTGVGGIQVFVGALFVVMATIGFIAGNSMAAAISSAGNKAGAASALVGVVQFLWGTVGSAIIGVYHDAEGRPMAVVIVALGLTALVICLRMRARSPTYASA